MNFAIPSISEVKSLRGGAAQKFLRDTEKTLKTRLSVLDSGGVVETRRLNRLQALVAHNNAIGRKLGTTSKKEYFRPSSIHMLLNAEKIKWRSISGEYERNRESLTTVANAVGGDRLRSVIDAMSDRQIAELIHTYKVFELFLVGGSDTQMEAEEIDEIVVFLNSVDV